MGFKIIIAEDEDITRKHLLYTLVKEGYEVVGTKNGREALEAMEKEYFDLLITDIKMPEMSGLELLEKIKDRYHATEVLIITGFGSIDSAVDAMKKGAYEYITKPFNLNELIVKIKNLHERTNLKKENLALRAATELNKGVSAIVKSASMQKIMEIVEGIKDSDCNVLLTGESGVGKGLLARIIHHTSRRQNMPFLTINCATLTEDLLAYELFGREKDSIDCGVVAKRGLVEIADRGTLFLKGSSMLFPNLQAKLLGIMEYGEFMRVDGTRPIAVNVRFIVSSDQDIKGLIAEGTFMKELYYKLNIADIFIPPLRDHKEDINPLCAYFLKKYSAISAKKIDGFTDETMDILDNYSFPGNIRELENIIERAVILERGSLITAESLPRSIKMFQIETFSPDGIKTIDELTRDYTEKVLGLVEGDKKKAAKLLGISEISLWRIIKE